MKFYSLLIVFLLLVPSCQDDDETLNTNPFTTIDGTEIHLTQTPINGVSFENVNFEVDDSHVNPIKSVNASWITTMPFGFVRPDQDSVIYNSQFQWVGETTEGVIDIINLCHDNDLEVMLKPHLWPMGQWIGDLAFDTEEEWQTFENSYTDYILEFAEIADSLDASAFCIGVEMKKVVVQRPSFWDVLIPKIRAVYSGPITYAANWDNYHNVTFWDQLDYIGIDAYFPVSELKNPTVEDCYNGWLPHFNEIKNLSNTVNKKVIFTEYGYRNVDFTGREPWDENDNTTFNEQAQHNAYEATFARFWGEEWFEGGFLWKWHPVHENAGGADNNRFTPQNKSVESLITQVFEETN